MSDSRTPRELRRDVSLWVRFNVGLGKVLWLFLTGVLLGLAWVWLVDGW